MGPSIFWLVVAVVFAVVEGLTISLMSIWFGIGALGGLLAAGLGASLIQQVWVFVAISTLSLLLLRPLAKKLVHSKFTPTNADRIVGGTAIVVEEIDNLKNTGIASVSGQMWTTRSQKDIIISVGTEVTVLGIEGVKIIVKPK